MDRRSQVKDFVMYNSNQKTGLSVRPISRARSIRCAFLDGCRPFFALPAVLASEVGYMGKTIEQKRLAPDSLIIPVFTTLPIGFLGRCFSVKKSRTTVLSLEVIILFICGDHSTPPLHGGGTWHGVAWSYADNFWVLARGANRTNIHLARLIAGVKKASLDVHDISLASGCSRL